MNENIKTTKILDGRALAGKIFADLAKEIQELKQKNVTPCLAVILVGNDPASEIYVNSKIKRCNKLGILSKKVTFPNDVSENAILTEIKALNLNPNVHGILIQMPLPKHINTMNVINALDANKDVDGFHPINCAKLINDDESGFVPCTPLGCLEMLIYFYEKNGKSLKGKTVTIIGRSMLVGKPLLLLLSKRGIDATITLTHSGTEDLKKHTMQSEIVVVAAGASKLLTADMIKEDSVILDVGINRIADEESSRGYRIVGDADFEEILDSKKATAISPVPGGIGPMTIAMLMKNTVKATKAF